VLAVPARPEPRAKADAAALPPLLVRAVPAAKPVQALAVQLLAKQVPHLKAAKPDSRRLAALVLAALVLAALVPAVRLASAVAAPAA
jgi:hypothetical protein